jgi:hypothetical protein
VRPILSILGRQRYGCYRGQMVLSGNFLSSLDRGET